MSSPSMGVTKVVFVRWTMSCVIRSPSCSARRISRASPRSSGQVWSISCRSLAARSVFCPASLKRSKNTRSRGTRLGSRTGGNLPIREDLGDPFGGPPVPKFRAFRLLGPVPRCGAVTQQTWDLRDAARVEPEQRVGPCTDGHRALGVGTQGEQGNAEVGCLLLDPAGVRENRRGLRLEGVDVEI